MVMPDEIKEHMEVVGNDGLHVGVIVALKSARLDLRRTIRPTG